MAPDEIDELINCELNRAQCAMMERLTRWHLELIDANVPADRASLVMAGVALDMAASEKDERAAA
jgi:hypothetical protein